MTSRRRVTQRDDEVDEVVDELFMLSDQGKCTNYLLWLDEREQEYFRDSTMLAIGKLASIHAVRLAWRNPDRRCASSARCSFR